MYDFLTVHVRGGGYIFFRKSKFSSMKTRFPEKKCIGVLCCDEKLDVHKNQTGWKNSISVWPACHAEQGGILKRP